MPGISRYPPVDYLASTWKILEQTAFEYIFPDESTAWVCEPNGTINVYRNFHRNHIRSGIISRAWVTQRIAARAEELNEYGFFTVYLDALARIPKEEKSRIKFYRTGIFIFYIHLQKIELISIG